MRDPETVESLRELYLRARRSEPAEALCALGSLAVGRPVYLACGGFALHAPGASAEIVDPDRPDEPVKLKATLDDETLMPWNLCLSAVERRGPINIRPRRFDRPVIALRLGLLMRCLDTAFLHLEGRESFGQKLLHHQLMKARFANSHADGMRLLDELMLSGNRLNEATLMVMHQIISQHFTSAAKLMGGHGFLAGSCHSLEFLSGLIFAMYRPSDVGALRSASRAGGG